MTRPWLRLRAPTPAPRASIIVRMLMLALAAGALIAGLKLSCASPAESTAPQTSVE